MIETWETKAAALHGGKNLALPGLVTARSQHSGPCRKQDKHRGSSMQFLLALHSQSTVKGGGKVWIVSNEESKSQSVTQVSHVHIYHYQYKQLNENQNLKHMHLGLILSN